MTARMSSSVTVDSPAQLERKSRRARADLLKDLQVVKDLNYVKTLTGGAQQMSIDLALKQAMEAAAQSAERYRQATLEMIAAAGVSQLK